MIKSIIEPDILVLFCFEKQGKQQQEQFMTATFKFLKNGKQQKQKYTRKKQKLRNNKK